MKRNKWIAGAAATTALLAMALVASAAQSGSTPFDRLEVRQEMETMKGILQTTIRFATESTSDGDNALQGIGEGIQGYFLLGQGAVFIIPVGSFESRENLEAVLALENSVRAAESQRVLSERYLRDIEREVREAMRTADLASRDALRNFDFRWESGELAPEPPEPPGADELPEPPEAPEAPEVAPPLPPGAPTARPGPRAAGRGVSGSSARAQAVDAQKRLQELHQRLTEKKADTEKRLKELEAELARLQEGLVDALARHGDSLSILRPEDSITLVLTHDGGPDFAFGRVFRIRGGSRSEETGTTVLSVKKSAISDLKAGRINHDQFLQKVVQYQQ